MLAAAEQPARGDMPPNTLTEAERRGGWRLLFNGRSIDGFRGWRRDDVPRGWVVEDDAIVRKSDGAGDLLTRDTFEHFELELDYRIAPGGNSGVLFHVTESAAAAWMSGPEVQILDNAAGADQVKAGWLYGLYEPKVPEWLVELDERSGRPRREWLDATRPAGAWNRLSLRVARDIGEVCLNGVSYLRFRKGDDDWNARVAASKFGASPDFGKAARGHICFQDHGDEVAFRSIKLRELDSEGRPVGAITEAELAVKAEPAFPGITWEGWSPENDDGTPAEPLRPLTLTHAGDGSGRRFVLDQSGMIHVVPGKLASDPPRARLFLDLRATTAPWRTANEEGLLGLAFHPQFRKTRAFFVCYCLAGEPRRQRISRFRVAADDPDRADPASEEVILEFEQPLPNHNGGSIAFGPDGFLYAGIGDGGGRDDPLRTAQRLDSILGKILRIDVDRRDEDRPYAVPADNPFVGSPGARAEIFAFGFRNPWQIAFDRETGRLWTADVGQDLREEIDVVEKGGNYGWSLREGSGPFGPDVAKTPTIDPVWEYDHGLGKSIVGGFVVRGSSLPALEGGYLYGDHVAGKLWLLRPHADPSQTVNASVPWNGLPVFGFGQDEAGDVYVLTSSPTGQGVHRLVEKPLTTVASILGEDLVQGDTPPPVDLEAVVTHRDATGTIFLRDGTGATFIALEPDNPMLPAGERVRVAGVVHRGLFINGIRHSRIERLGDGPRPEPKPVTPQQLAAGSLHYEWVSLEGVGRRWRAGKDGGGTLDLNVADGVVEARLERATVGAEGPPWIGARVRVQGIAAGEINDRRQLIRPYLLVPDDDDVVVIEPAPTDPFALPETSFSALGRGEFSGRLQRVEGVVAAAPRGERLFLFDGQAGLYVGLSDAYERPAAIHAGDRVEVVGFVEPGPFATRIAEARVRVVTAGDPVAVRRPGVAELKSGCDGQLVELAMVVVDRDDRERGTTLACEFQGIPMRVVSTEKLAAAVVPMATVRVTAPCVVSKTSEAVYSLRAAAYDLFPAGAADVVAIRRPSWWNVRRLGLLLAASLTTAAAAVGWIVLLRRQVARQLAVIEEKIQVETVAEERRRIAREFHDSLEQDLSGLALRLDSAAGSMADPEARRVMERQREIVARLRDETRHYVWDLRDPARLQGSLADRVEALLGELRDVHASPIALEAGRPLPTLPPETTHHLLQMLREAVSNAARHARAGRIGVRLCEENGGVVASVTDDGIGFEPVGDGPAAGHFGLRGLTERADRIGAIVSVDSRPGAGTTVTIRLPAPRYDDRRERS